jgi:antitoxin ParD1/3/4
MPMNVNLTPQLEEMIRQKVASGFYNSASEVVREALRLMEQQDRQRQIRLEELRREIQRGIDSGPAAPLDMDAIRKRCRARFATEQQKQAEC